MKRNSTTNSCSSFVVCLAFVLMITNFVFGGNLDSDYMRYQRELYALQDRNDTISAILNLPDFERDEIEYLTNYFLGSAYSSREELAEFDDASSDYELLSQLVSINKSSRSPGKNIRDTYYEVYAKNPKAYDQAFDLFMGSIELILEREFPYTESTFRSNFPIEYLPYFDQVLSAEKLGELESLVYEIASNRDVLRRSSTAHYLLECYLNQKVDFDVLDSIRSLDVELSNRLIYGMLKFAEAQELIDYGINRAEELRHLEMSEDVEREINLVLDFLHNHPGNVEVQQFLFSLVLGEPGNYRKFDRSVLLTIAKEKPEKMWQQEWELLQSRLFEQYESRLSILHEKWQ